MTVFQKKEIDDLLNEVECFLLASAQAHLMHRNTCREALGSAVMAGADSETVGQVREAMVGLQNNCNYALDVAELVEKARHSLWVEPTSNDTPDELLSNDDSTHSRKDHA